MNTAILTGILALLPMASWAAGDITPFDVKLGLWEQSVTTETAGGPARPRPQISPEDLAKIPPQQRAQIEAMLKSSTGPAAPMITKTCRTRESLNREFTIGPAQKSCTRKVISSSASKQVIHIECVNGEIKTEGDMVVERVDAEHVKGTVSMKTDRGPQQMNTKMSISSKWLSSDCGAVKPKEDK